MARFPVQGWLRRVAAAAALTAAATGLATPVSATLIGDAIDISIVFGHPAGLPTASGYTAADIMLAGVTVQDTSASPEAPASYTGNLGHAFGTVTVDVDATQLALGLFLGTDDPAIEPAFIAPMTIRLENLDWLGAPMRIVDVVDPNGVTAALSGGDPLTGTSWIEIAVPGQALDPGGLPFLFTVIPLDIVTGPLAVPAPASLVLFALALGGLGATAAAGRRRLQPEEKTQ
jgi:hypothetical protein